MLGVGDFYKKCVLGSVPTPFTEEIPLLERNSADSLEKPE
jgi:hypothetical protein